MAEQHFSYRIVDNNLIRLTFVADEDQAIKEIYEEIAARVGSGTLIPVDGDRQEFDINIPEQMNEWLKWVWYHLDQFGFFMVELFDKADGFQLTLGVHTIET
jgi:hypothetical protein